MLDRHIYGERVSQFIDHVGSKRYSATAPLAATYVFDPKNPIPYKDALKAKYRPLKIGGQWGDTLWGSAWFRFTGKVPQQWKGKEVFALIDIEGEGLVFDNGEPVQGLTSIANYQLPGSKRLVPLYRKAAGGESVSLMVEGAANAVFGVWGGKSFALRTAEIITLDRTVWDLFYDMHVLQSIYKGLPADSVRRHRILSGLNDAANVWNNGVGAQECLRITRALLDVKASQSALTVYGIGHAHLDLGWLWPTRESRRKGARTFSNALRMIDEYPEYKFGASQPQLYEWIKQDYPGLYKRVQAAVKAKKWECQGAMWVEPDMNVTGGEALVRQCLYGKALYKKDFGVDVRNLWLPDVFGYSAALPQILKKCGVDVFMTQKISWNETNVFPHHTFYWEGVDGTRILTHFLPANDYNSSNWPGQMIDTEKRYAQSDVSDEFLNLFGSGDGGGGPSRAHIEFGMRQRNTDGVPKYRFSFAADFFKKIAAIPEEKLPRWVGELYLELHRGTYTTQGRMKRYNRKLELELRDVEYFCTLAAIDAKKELDEIWKNTLLNQFHDILPGSSITLVYDDAHAMSEKNLARLAAIRTRALESLHGKAGNRGTTQSFMVHNTLSWERTSVVHLAMGAGEVDVIDATGAVLPVMKTPGGIDVQIRVPAMGCSGMTVRSRKPGTNKTPPVVTATTSTLENDLLRVRIASDGTISSIFDKERDCETLAGSANVLQVWEDKPRSWEAWDISHYYRETKPQHPQRTACKVTLAAGPRAEVMQSFTVGTSRIHQLISLTAGSRLVRIDNTVVWDETQKMLRVSARPDVHAAEASYEIQYATVRRPTHVNTSWERMKFEVPGQRFCDLSQNDRGFAVVNDSKYGYHVEADVIDLTLLRSPCHPDPIADRGTHEFTFGYLPHGGTLIQSDVLRVAHELNSPAVVVPVAHAGARAALSFFDASGTVKIEVVKQAESGKGTVLRLYETAGCDGKTVLTSSAGWKSISECDMLENVQKRLGEKGTKISLSFKPFEIRTFILG